MYFLSELRACWGCFCLLVFVKQCSFWLLLQTTNVLAIIIFIRFGSYFGENLLSSVNYQVENVCKNRTSDQLLYPRHSKSPSFRTIFNSLHLMQVSAQLQLTMKWKHFSYRCYLKVFFFFTHSSLLRFYLIPPFHSWIKSQLLIPFFLWALPICLNSFILHPLVSEGCSENEPPKPGEDSRSSLCTRV